MSFAKQLRTYRIMEGLTQAQLADRAHTTQDYISNLEKAKHCPGVEMVVRLADALHVNWRDLLFNLVLKR